MLKLSRQLLGGKQLRRRLRRRTDSGDSDPPTHTTDSATDSDPTDSSDSVFDDEKFVDFMMSSDSSDFGDFPAPDSDLGVKAEDSTADSDLGVKVKDSTVDSDLGVKVDDSTAAADVWVSPQHMGRWKLHSDLTREVFSRLGDDTLTILCLEATCRTFRECAKDPRLFTHIRVVCPTDYIGDSVLSRLIDRATSIRSLEIALREDVDEAPIPVFARSFMNTFRGDSLERLVLRHFGALDERNVVKLLSSCPKLKHLEIILCGCSLRDVLRYLTRKCTLLETLEAGGEHDRLSTNRAKKIGRRWPRLRSVRIEGCPMSDEAYQTLVKNCENLEDYGIDRGN